MRKLVIYPNLSLGGVTSVLRGRAAAEPKTEFDFVFLNDRGGRDAFADFDNVQPRIVNRSRLENFLTYSIPMRSYNEAYVLSHPDAANFISSDPNLAVTYEFHSSDLKVIERELDALKLENLARITAPSHTMVEKISGMLPARYRHRVSVIPNLVDPSVFHQHGPSDLFNNDPNIIPLVWVGRFDRGKGFRYLPRLLALLPENYVAYVVVSLESDPGRPTEFLNEANALGVAHRVRLLANLERPKMANLYRSAAKSGGWLVSTSLMESFGYAIVEALACGLC